MISPMRRALPPQELAADQYEYARTTTTGPRVAMVARCVLACAAALLAINDTLRERLPRP